MLKCNALARAALRASKYDVPQTTRALSQLSILPQSHASNSTTVSHGYTLSSIRGLATKVAKQPTRKTATGGKKTTTKKRVSGKAAPKKQKKPTTTRKVKKVVKKKAAPKKKVLSERQKLLAEKKEEKDRLATLKATALEEPKRLPETAWVVYFAEKAKGTSGTVTDNIRAAASAYKSLDAKDVEHYNHIANQNKAANQEAYKTWVLKYTPDQIRLANNARKLLKRKLPATKAGTKQSGRGLSPIVDPRQIKRPDNAFLTFAVERRNSGDMKNISLGDSSKLIGQEWKALSAGEKKKYSDLQVADKERYIREYSRTYGHPPSPPAKSKTVDPLA